MAIVGSRANCRPPRGKGFPGGKKGARGARRATEHRGEIREGFFGEQRRVVEMQFVVTVMVERDLELRRVDRMQVGMRMKGRLGWLGCGLCGTAVGLRLEWAVWAWSGNAKAEHCRMNYGLHNRSLLQV
ncbi:hypothetical protein BDZ91DRAFT_764207 [Kalaharituber pfeilii]|nr:hypothetical protein BDZ91DRAFT_764207 [Kalaharituber pfeilii]